MNVTSIAQGFVGSAPFAAGPNLFLCRVLVYLFRDARPRPIAHLYGRVESQPDYPFRRVASIPTGGPDLEFYADHSSLLAPHPLRFHALVLGIGREPFDIAPYNLTGGGGSACPADDARTLLALSAALRSFPSGWHIGFDMNDPNDGKFSPEVDAPLTVPAPAAGSQPPNPHDL